MRKPATAKHVTVGIEVGETNDGQYWASFHNVTGVGDTPDEAEDDLWELVMLSLGGL